jgi:putative DNA-invertase from lambdoid prophage Rac
MHFFGRFKERNRQAARYYNQRTQLLYRRLPNGRIGMSWRPSSTRASTSDQTLEHQRTQAEAAGFTLDRVIADNGVSGVSTRLAERAEGRRLFDILRSGDTLVVRWVDRLGRSYSDVTDVIREFMRRGVVIRTVINNMTFDGATKNPMEKAVRDALIAFMAATAEAQAEATKQAQRAGIEHARAKGDGYRGRKPSYTREQLRSVNRQRIGTPYRHPKGTPSGDESGR